VQAVTVTLESRAEDMDGLDVEGYVPFADCPIAVTPFYVRHHGDTMWEGTDKWCISQRRTGFNLGRETWNSKEDAMAVLLRCDPTFPAWPLATGADDCRATQACRVKFREALAHG